MEKAVVILLRDSESPLRNNADLISRCNPEDELLQPAEREHLDSTTFSCPAADVEHPTARGNPCLRGDTLNQSSLRLRNGPSTIPKAAVDMLARSNPDRSLGDRASERRFTYVYEVSTAAPGEVEIETGSRGRRIRMIILALTKLISGTNLSSASQIASRFPYTSPTGPKRE